VCEGPALGPGGGAVLGARGAGRPRYSHALCYSRAGAYPLEHAAPGCVSAAGCP